MAPPVTAKTDDQDRRSARERIFEAAKELFYENGIRAVGVEGIAAHAGTTKMSLYRNFHSKDELVAECLQDHKKEFWDWWESVVAPYPDDPRAQMFALIDAFVREGCATSSHGCPLANAIVEINSDDHPGRKVVMEHKNEMRRRLRQLARDIGARDPEELGDALMLLVEGAYICQITFHHEKGPIHSLAGAVRTLVDAHVESSQTAA